MGASVTLQHAPLASSHAQHIALLMHRASQLVERLRAPPEGAAESRKQEHDALMVHQLLLEAAERLPRPEASPAPAPRGVLVPTQAARAGSAPLETVPELPRMEDENHQMPALHSSHHKRDRSIQFNEDDRGFWAQSLEELMAAIAPHNAARVAPAAPSGDNHKPAAGSC